MELIEKITKLVCESCNASVYEEEGIIYLSEGLSKFMCDFCISQKFNTFLSTCEEEKGDQV